MEHYVCVRNDNLSPDLVVYEVAELTLEEYVDDNGTHFKGADCRGRILQSETQPDREEAVHRIGATFGGWNSLQAAYLTAVWLVRYAA